MGMTNQLQSKAGNAAKKKQVQINKAAKLSPTTTTAKVTTAKYSTTSNNNTASMYATEKKIQKELKKQHKKMASTSPSSAATSSKEIEPPRLHRDMRLICDVFRVSEQTRHALRSFDAVTLEDFSMMTDEDYGDLVVTFARLGHPMPPLQQRKLRVLLTWVQSLATEENLELVVESSKGASTETESSNGTKGEGFELRESKKNNLGILKASYKNTGRPRASKGGGTFVPPDWEDRFYKDLPDLRRELKGMGKERTWSNFALGFLSFKWIVCG